MNDQAGTILNTSGPNTSNLNTSGLALKDHNLVSDDQRQRVCEGVLFEKRPAKAMDGTIVPGLYNAWITLDNQAQFNSYTTQGCSVLAA
ncbi:MAG: hypothetical protein ACXWVS_03905 [Hyphomicrobium sp.]